jgi:hypothetical protein
MSESKGMSLASHPHLVQFGASGGGVYAANRRRGRNAQKNGALPAGTARAGANPLIDFCKRRP